MARGDFCLLAEGTWPGQTPGEPPLWVHLSLLSPLGNCGGLRMEREVRGHPLPPPPAPGHPVTAGRGSQGCPCVRGPALPAGGPGGMSVHPRSSPAPHSGAIPPQPPCPSPPSAPPHNPTAGALARKTSDIRWHLGKLQGQGSPRAARPCPTGGIHGEGGAAPPNPAGFGSLSFPSVAFLSCCQTRCASLLREQTVVIPHFALFLRLPPTPNGGCQCPEPAVPHCRSRVRK